MASGLNIVVVEDHEGLLEVTVDVLRQEGHRVTGLSCAESLDDEGGKEPVDLLLVDLNLPGEDGLSLARRFRAAQPNAAVIMMTARNGLADRVAGYNHGADLYLPKPVDPAELVAAVSAMSRRLQAQREASAPADLVLDVKALRVCGHLGEARVSRSEAALLTAFARAAGRLLESWQIIEVLGEDPETYTKANVEVRLARLRSKLQAAGADADCLRSVRLRGYQLCGNLTIA